MNYNVISYLIYLPIITFIMVYVGWRFYREGEIFLIDLFPTNIKLAGNINKLLLIGYYLTNIGYAITTIAVWKEIENPTELINSLTSTVGKIILILAILHYNNLYWLNYLSKSEILN